MIIKIALCIIALSSMAIALFVFALWRASIRSNGASLQLANQIKRNSDELASMSRWLKQQLPQLNSKPELSKIITALSKTKSDDIS